MCGAAYPGELLVIMGSSGAGKTTLLNALTFRSGRGVTVSGTMAANGQRVTSSVLTSRMAYVQQDDLFVGTLTVKEHLLFQAMVRMNRQIPFKQRVHRVDEVISEVRIYNYYYLSLILGPISILDPLYHIFWAHINFRHYIPI